MSLAKSIAASFAAKSNFVTKPSSKELLDSVERIGRQLAENTTVQSLKAIFTKMMHK